MSANLESIIHEQLDLHDGYTVQDLYKLIHQAVYGIHHLLSDEQAAFRALQEEFDGLGPTVPGEPLLEVIDPRGIVHRVNLRSHRSDGGVPEDLWKAVLLTRDRIRGSKSQFTSLWDEARRLIASRSVPFRLREFEEFESRTMADGHPIVHHSESYRRVNRPAYRIVAAQFLNIIHGV